MQMNAAVANRRTQPEPTFKPLFLPHRLGNIELTNRLVMAPTTRSRALAHNVPNPLAVTYYAQRASAGLIVTEATQVSPQGVGYIPFVPKRLGRTLKNVLPFFPNSPENDGSLEGLMTSYQLGSIVLKL